jgi:hypothetical protein
VFAVGTSRKIENPALVSAKNAETRMGHPPGRLSITRCPVEEYSAEMKSSAHMLHLIRGKNAYGVDVALAALAR